MHTIRRVLFCAVATLAFSGFTGICQADEPGYAGKILLRGVEKEAKDNTDILLRPYRPLHFYGNTVRRVHYRGQLLPRPRDFRNFAAAQ